MNMAKKKAPKFQEIVIVRWLDATEDDTGWKHPDDDDWSPDPGLEQCESVGFLTVKSRRKICLRGDQAADGGVGRRTAIPSGWADEIIVIAKRDEDGFFWLCCPKCGMQRVGKDDQ